MTDRGWDIVNIGRETLVKLLFTILAISLVFEMEIPINSLGSDYASINSGDIAILIISVVATLDIVKNNKKIQITLEQVTSVLVVATGWIVITLIVASVRSPSPILLSTLWVLKWFEGLILFILAQSYLNTSSGKLVVKIFYICGIVLSVVSILNYILTDTYRVRIFFGNPNTLSIFLNLTIIFGISHYLRSGSYSQVIYVFLSFLGGVALLLTGSRSGVLGLLVGTGSILLLQREQITAKMYKYSVVIGIVLLSTIPVLLPTGILKRLTGWVVIQNGTVSLTNTTAARSFRIRIRLINRAWELFLEQPVFGYGWYASPSRIGYLDVHYTTLLAEIGIIGLAIFTLLYIFILRSWFQIGQYRAVGLIGTAWFVSVLVQSIGGNFPRTPQIFFIILLFVSASQAINPNRIKRIPST